MKRLVLLTLASLSPAAFASTTYLTHFENPVVDSRIAFTACVVTGALIGIAQGKPGDVLCTGSLKSDTSKKPAIYYVLKIEGQQPLEYFEQTDSKLVSSAGGEEGGKRVWSVKMQEVSKDLTAPNNPHVGMMKIDQSWEYSEGTVMYSGHLPGKAKKFEGSSFELDKVDEELRVFISQISQ